MLTKPPMTSKRSNLPPTQKSNMIAKESTLHRRTRTKLRKPKFLSLRLQLFSGNTAAAPPPPMPTTGHDHTQQLINLFPLHPENLVEQEEHNMAACIFSSCDDDGAATTLTGILCSDDDEEEENHQNNENMNNPSPASVNFADDDGELVRTAMRRNNYKTENDDDYSNGEKWVFYSEVVERKKAIRGLSCSSLTSSSSTSCNRHHRSRSKFALKLDYEKIMKSWVNKGPLYIHDNPGMDTWQPQTVPDLRDDDFFLPSSATLNGMSYDERDNGSNGGLWTVPEMTRSENNDTTASATIHNREASVQRYKEKRRNRLFAKTIRYEVRKLNAEKRPRIKGRFVKRK